MSPSSHPSPRINLDFLRTTKTLLRLCRSGDRIALAGISGRTPHLAWLLHSSGLIR
jgi:hypothetical protein